ncbi:hypothetical protein SAMN06264364_13448 [Quadrisphaera granulorum]|uniref:Probable membrane transporter protein n=1 Tax=Quadrisphaera granulorum TaxID=317664 RepID=A0A315ZRW8_9ACTN|nr:sulfite exporter TauE/SafE family protein [Quadrisphaera granulorum]PWJ47873.1 hypothetical protein BXY45_13448 [Quadrisphaera granulorum]SZE98640.1 hypothetical protein SAMN06264364_13448 [Quadrisphaera granulorum]
MTAALITVALGVAVGLVLGVLGGGGAILTVPALVYLLGMPAREATVASLVIVGVAAATSSATHARAGAVRWGAALVFVAVGVPATVAGAALNHRVPAGVVLVSFAVVMLTSAAAMVYRSLHRAAPIAAEELCAPLAPARRDGGALGSLGAEDVRGPVAVRAPVAPPCPTTHNVGPSRRCKALSVVAAGLLVGLLTGFLGVGGGFVIVPALVLALGLAMPVAVGTSLVVIALNSGVSLLARAGTAHFDWAVIVPFTLGAVAASFAGRPLAARLSARTAGLAFAGMLVLVAAYILLRSAGALG